MYPCFRSETQFELPIPYYSDPWKSNEQQMAFVVKVDLDAEENQHPKQRLEDTEQITPIFVPVSSLFDYVYGREQLFVFNGQNKSNKVSAYPPRFTSSPLYSVTKLFSSSFDLFEFLIVLFVQISMFPLVPYESSSSDSESEPNIPEEVKDSPVKESEPQPV